MTRKHYEAIARIIEQHYDPEPFTTDGDRQNDIVIKIANDLADYFAANKKFNRDKFMKVCFGGDE